MHNQSEAQEQPPQVRPSCPTPSPLAKPSRVHGKPGEHDEEAPFPPERGDRSKLTDLPGVAEPWQVLEAGPRVDLEAVEQPT